MIRFFATFVLILTALPAANETLRYSVNWPTGLSLGEATMSTDNIDAASAANRSLEFRLEASIPGFAVVDEVKSLVSGAYCLARAEKNLQHGKRVSRETLKVEKDGRSVERQTDKGGKSVVAVGDCPKDALGFIYWLRSELRQGRLPAPGPVAFGAVYEIEMRHAGVTTLNLGAGREEADKFQVFIKGPASRNAIELFVGKDSARTPLLFRVPLVLGAFTMELLR
jgi:hypothetical protein